MSDSYTSGGSAPEQGARRDFLYVSAAAFTTVGIAAAIWPFIDSLNPSADVLALSTTELDLEPIELGQRVTFKWRGQPLFVVRRTPELIARAEADDNAGLLSIRSRTARVFSVPNGSS